MIARSGSSFLGSGGSTPRPAKHSRPPSRSAARDTPSPPSCRRTPKPARRKHNSLDHLTRLQPAFILSPLEPMPVSSNSNPQSAGNVPDSERPRRAASSPQLVRTRARSDSASSSASLTATEDNYARLHARAGYGRNSVSASTSRFQTTTYPPLWAFAASPESPTSPDWSEAASPSDDDNDGSEESSDEVEEEGDDLIFVSRASSSTSVSSGLHVRPRRRRKSSEILRVVTTGRGQACFGETETELDEQPIRLPTSRTITSRPVVPLLIDYLVPFLFQVTRFLSIIPASFGFLYNIYWVVYPPPFNLVKISSIDYFACALWAILTGFQCLYLTTGLLSRWKAYYTTPSTLIRLVALQCICWPATHLTLVFFDHTRRPVACWALIGTTTCISRSVQLWVTSNLYFMPVVAGDRNLSTATKVLRSEGRLGPRRWDWAEVMVKCALPAGVLYFVTAWALILKQELRSYIGMA